MLALQLRAGTWLPEQTAPQLPQLSMSVEPEISQPVLALPSQSRRFDWQVQAPLRQRMPGLTAQSTPAATAPEPRSLQTWARSPLQKGRSGTQTWGKQESVESSEVAVQIQVSHQFLDACDRGFLTLLEQPSRFLAP